MEKNKIENVKNNEDKINNPILAIVRISGMVKVRKDIEETLDRLKIRRKYSCVIINKNDKNIYGMLKKVKYYVAYGNIDKEVLRKLIEERAENIEGRKSKIKINSEEVAEGLFKNKRLKDFGLKEFFRLHPPRKGIKSKLHYPKGVLGDNKKDINKLIERMLWWEVW